MADAMKKITMTVKVTRTREFATRLRLGTFLLKLAARVMGCGIKVEFQEPAAGEK